MSHSNPNKMLAEKISSELLLKNLIDASSSKKFVSDLGSGKINDSDWKIFLEEVINKPKANSDETE